jgi:hypothetical protein
MFASLHSFSGNKQSQCFAMEIIVETIARSLFQEINKVINPENLLPPGVLMHLVTRTEGGLSISDVWEDEAAAKPFNQGASEAFGIEFLSFNLYRRNIENYSSL